MTYYVHSMYLPEFPLAMDWRKINDGMKYKTNIFV